MVIMNDLLTLAKKILDCNPNAALTGTLMLKLRGIDLGRVPKDIDIVLNGFGSQIIEPEGCEFKLNGLASDQTSIQYWCNGIIIDVLSSGEEVETINGWRLGSIEKLIRAKQFYSKQSNPEAKKHKEDLEILTKYLGIEIEDETVDELPF